MIREKTGYLKKKRGRDKRTYISTNESFSRCQWRGEERGEEMLRRDNEVGRGYRRREGESARDVRRMGD